MAEQLINLTWQRTTEDFNIKTYSRTHTVKFSGGNQIEASASADFLGDAKMPNPKELLLASVASCHLLTFLAIAANKGFTIDNYSDSVYGVLGKTAEGRTAVTQIVLRPKISFSGATQPDAATLHEMHEKAHELCTIANTVNCEIKIEE